MPILQVRDVPDDLYETLVKEAKSDNRSIAQETIVLLRDALNIKQECIARREKILKNIQDVDIPDSANMPDPALLIRADRER